MSIICPYCQQITTDFKKCLICGRQLNTSDVLWWLKLCEYSYPANLATYSERSKYPGYFESSPDKRESTVHFEDHFREAIKSSDPPVGPFLEVMFWKMYSQRGRAEIRTKKLGEFLSSSGNKAKELKTSIESFIVEPSDGNAKSLITACGLASRTIAVAFTFPALYKSSLYPMVDTRVAKWVNNKIFNGESTLNGLIRFQMNYTSLQMNDFDAYLCWIDWCRKQAAILHRYQPEVKWRPRDVEMACFTDIACELPML